MDDPRIRRAGYVPCATVPRGAVVALGCLGLLGVVLAFWRLGLPEVWYDEYVYRTAALAYRSGDFAPNFEHPPLGKLILAAWPGLDAGYAATRVLMGFVALAIAGALWWVAAHFVGWLWGSVAGLAWLLLPHRFESRARLDHLVFLDPFMVLFLVLGYGAAWHWFQTRSLRWAAAAGALVGAAAMAKLSALFVLPALLVFFVGPGRARVVRKDVAAFAAGALGTMLLFLAPMGGPGALLRMVGYQREHNADGHPVLVAGQAFDATPWWATFRYAWDGLGAWATVVLVAALVLAVRFVRPLRLVALLLASLASFWVLFAQSRVALPHYYYDWVWLPTLALGLVLPALAEGATRWARTALVLLVAGAVVATGANAVGVLGERESGLVLVAHHVPPGRVLVAGLPPSSWPDAHLDEVISTLDAPYVQAVVVGNHPLSPVPEPLRLLVDEPPPGVQVEEVDGYRIATWQGTLALEGDRYRIVG